MILVPNQVTSLDFVSVSSDHMKNKVDSALGNAAAMEQLNDPEEARRYFNLAMYYDALRLAAEIYS